MPHGEPSADAAAVGLLVQGVAAGRRVTLVAEGLDGEVIRGTSPALGPGRIDLTSIDRLLVGRAIDDEADELPYRQWRLRPAVEPRNPARGRAACRRGAPCAVIVVRRLGGHSARVARRGAPARGQNCRARIVPRLRQRMPQGGGRGRAADLQPVAAEQPGREADRRDDQEEDGAERRDSDRRAHDRHEAHPRPVGGEAESHARARGDQRECREAPEPGSEPVAARNMPQSTNWNSDPDTPSAAATVTAQRRSSAGEGCQLIVIIGEAATGSVPARQNRV